MAGINHTDEREYYQKLKFTKTETLNTTELVKNEIEFCNEIDCKKNEHGQFIYESKNGKSTMNLPYALQEYKQWLIDKRLVKEVQ